MLDYLVKPDRAAYRPAERVREAGHRFTTLYGGNPMGKSPKTFFCLLLLTLLAGSAYSSSDRQAPHETKDGLQGLPADVSGRLVASAPFEIQRNRVILPVSIKGSRPLDIILDTGMAWPGIYLFHKEIIDEIGVEAGFEARVPGAGGGEASTAIVVDSVRASMGEAEFPEQRVIISNSDLTQRFPTEGVIGGTVLNTYVFGIDFDSRMVHLYDTTGVTVDTSWYAADITLKKGIPWIPAEITVAGGPSVPVLLYLDSAAGEALELLVRPEMAFALPESLKEEYLGTGLSGDVCGKVGSIDLLTIGPFRLFDVPTAFPPAEIRSRQEGADGVLGGMTLRRFNVIFDYSRNKMYLKPNKTYSIPFDPGERN
jgi:hypothetical protein